MLSNLGSFSFSYPSSSAFFGIFPLYLVTGPLYFIGDAPRSSGNFSFFCQVFLSLNCCLHGLILIRFMGHFHLSQLKGR